MWGIILYNNNFKKVIYLLALWESNGEKSLNRGYVYMRTNYVI